MGLGKGYSEKLGSELKVGTEVSTTPNQNNKD